MKIDRNLFLPSPNAYKGERRRLLEDIYRFPYWRQRIPLDEKAFTPGYITNKVWETSFLPNELQGNSFLDIGANDGLISFLAEQKGASPVFATDLYSGEEERGSNQTGLSDKGIRTVKAFLGSKVEVRSLDFYRLDELERDWDIVYISNVLLWLKDPDRALELLAKWTRKTLYLRNLFLDPLQKGHYRFNDQKGTYDMDLSYAVERLRKAGFKRIKTRRIPSNQNASDIHFPLTYLPKGTRFFSDPCLQEPLTTLSRERYLPLTGQLDGAFYLKRSGWIDGSKSKIPGLSGVKGKAKQMVGPQRLERWKRWFQKRNDRSLYVLIAEK